MGAGMAGGATGGVFVAIGTFGGSRFTGMAWPTSSLRRCLNDVVAAGKTKSRGSRNMKRPHLILLPRSSFHAFLLLEPVRVHLPLYAPMVVELRVR